MSTVRWTDSEGDQGVVVIGRQAALQRLGLLESSLPEDVVGLVGARDEASREDGLGFALALAYVTEADLSSLVTALAGVPWSESAGLCALGMLVGERLRQVRDRGYDAEHDDGHPAGELGVAAAAYALPVDDIPGVGPRASLWPFEPEAFKPACGEGREHLGGRLAELAKAGALVLAEMERVLREIDRFGPPDPAAEAGP